MPQRRRLLHFYRPIEEIHAGLDAKMTKAFHAVMSMAHKTHTRLGAYLVAVKRAACAVNETTRANAMPPQDPELWRRHGMELLGPPLNLP